MLISVSACRNEGKGNPADSNHGIIKTSKGLVIILGCAHRGVINTLLYARKITGENRIYMVMGGAHLVNASRERIYKTIAALRALGIEKIGLSHCTGDKATVMLIQEFGEDFFFNRAGTELKIE